jgi:DNA polymerase-1
VPRLILIDCYSLLFRAFFASSPLSTSDGRPTGALYGFSNMLLTLLEREKPDAIYAAWDAPGKTFREEMYEAYKGHRPDVAEELKTQFPVAREIMQVFGIPSVESQGMEADDWIGTLSVIGARKGYDVVIISGDSDQLQLIRDSVRVRMTQRGVTETVLFDAEEVRKKYGVNPEQIPDFKALVGDTSDNIPGVPGVGKVTAAKLLQEWGSLKNLLAHAEELPQGKVRNALIQGKETALLSLELATIKCDIPFDGDIQPYDPGKVRWAEARALFENLEFKSLLRRLPKTESAAEEIPRTPGESTLLGRERNRPRSAFSAEAFRITTYEEFRAVLNSVRKSGRVAIRLHTDSLDGDAELKGIGIAATSDCGWYAPVVKSGMETRDSALGGLFQTESESFMMTLEDVKALLLDSSAKRTAHDAKQTIRLLSEYGLPPMDFHFDTYLADYLLDASHSTRSLMDLAERVMDVKWEAENAFDPEVILAREAALLLALEDRMTERLVKDDLYDILLKLEMPVATVLAQMEREGVLVDKKWLETLSNEMAMQIDTLCQKIYAIAGHEFTINSPKQLQTVLFEELKLPSGKKTKTGLTTNAELLESLASQYEIAALILEYRELSKLKSAYADALPKLIHPKTGRIHTTFNQTSTTTGRLSSSDPNLQNVPVRSEAGRRIRKAFIAPTGQVLLSCDYSQIELRVFAHYTRDARMMEAFERDEDIHAATASTLFGVPQSEVTGEMRRRAKTVNFAVIYGQSDFGLANSLGISQEEAREFKKRYFEQFPGVREYTLKTVEQARTNGYVTTLLGRRRYIPDISAKNFSIRQAAERAAVNMPIQGTAADMMKQAMVNVYHSISDLCYNCFLELQVHDELVFRVDKAFVEEAGRKIVSIMECAFPLDVPVRVDAKYGENWMEMTPLPR